MQRKRSRGAPSPTLLLPLVATIFLLSGHPVRSFSSIGPRQCDRNPQNPKYRIRCPSSVFSPSFSSSSSSSSSTFQRPSAALHAGNNDDDDNDHKIEWNPESNPKIAQLPSYSDNWLLNFHNWDQSEKQLATNSLAAWNEEIRNKQATIIEWQDSFQRNDLADFTPPMSNGLNCLMVGGDFDVYEDATDGTRRLKLPWEDVPEAQITSLRVLEESITTSVMVVDDDDDETDAVPPIDEETVITIDNFNEDDGVSIVPSTGMGQTSGEMVLRTELVSQPTDTTAENQNGSSDTAIRPKDPNKPAATYDCIVDQGLMDRVLAIDNNNNNLMEKTVCELLGEAAVAMKEFGIYVLVTKTKVLTDDARRLLEQYGLESGFEWEFELDGISDERQVVSVARRFNTGEMPKVGRLSRYQP